MKLSCREVSDPGDGIARLVGRDEPERVEPGEVGTLMRQMGIEMSGRRTARREFGCGPGSLRIARRSGMPAGVRIDLAGTVDQEQGTLNASMRCERV